MTRFGNAVQRIDERRPGVDLPLLSVSQTRGVLRQIELTGRPHRAESLDPYKICREGDIVFNKMSIRTGAMGVAGEDGLVTYHYEVMRPRQNVSSDFINYVMKSDYFRGELVRRERGIGAGGHAGVRTTEVPFSSLRLIDIYLPSLEQQDRISQFLDRETAKIDTLIAKQEQLITTLDGRRGAVISRAVTRGIVENRPMRDSGVEWLGDVPENWSVKQLKRVFRRVKRELAPDLGIVTAFRDGQVTLRSNRRSEGFTEADDYSNYQRIEPNDLAIHAMDAFAGAIGVCDSTGMCSPVLSVCSPSADHEPRYMAYVLRTMANRGWIEALSRSIRERTSEFRWAEAGVQKVPVPPTDEQRRIADFLDRETAKIDQLRVEAKRMVAILAERRQALISAVVAGKLEVTDGYS